VSALNSLSRAIGDHEADPSYLLITRDSMLSNLESNTWVDLLELLGRILFLPDILSLPRGSKRQVV
jgi:hypothetical protein